MQRIEIKLIDKNNGQIEGVPKNPRQWRKGEVEKLARSIEQTPELFDLRPIIVYDNVDGYVAIGGNMRLEAAKLLKWKDVPCEIVSRETPTAKLKEIVIKDNSAFGEWDMDMLANEWDDLPLNEWGLPLGDWNSEVEETPKVQDDNFDESKEKIEPRCKKGDIWQLGEHRLMCGDSTNANDVTLLMDGQKADITFTSPPYNVMSQFANKHIKDKGAYLVNDTYEEYSDDLTDTEYFAFLKKALANALQNSKDVFFNIGCCKGALFGTAKMIGEFAEYFKGIITWKKSGAFMLFFPAQFGVVGNITEPIYCFSENKQRKFAEPQWKQGDAVYNIIETQNASGNEHNDVNAATFPIDLPAEAIKLFCKDSVLDLFCGTGTTLLAADQLGKKCFAMELSAKECDIIIARWEKLTNKKAVKL